MICAMSPLSTLNSLQSSVLVPTMRSTCAPAPAAIRSIGSPGMTSPSTTGCHSNVLVTTSSPQRSGSGCARQLGLQLRLRREQSLDGDGGDRLPGRRHTQPLGQVPPDPRRRLGRDHLMGRAALRDRSPEQPLGAGHGEQGADAHRTSRLTEDGDVGGITAEGGDVVPDPLQGRDLVEQAEVGGAVAQIQEPVGPDAPVEDHADDAVAGEATAVVRRLRAELEHAAWIHTMTGSPDAAGSGVQMLRFRQSSPVTSAPPAESPISMGRQRPEAVRLRTWWRHARHSRARPAGADGAGSRRTAAPRRELPGTRTHRQQRCPAARRARS